MVSPARRREEVVRVPGEFINSRGGEGVPPETDPKVSIARFSKRRGQSSLTANKLWQLPARSRLRHAGTAEQVLGCCHPRLRGDPEERDGLKARDVQ